ncbi:MAG TPA: SWIM zinc finger family protein [Trebonia sp.]
MPARWSAESVLALAPDESSRRAAKGLARPSPWSGTGTAGELVWGLCAGSGANPYQVIADLDAPAYKCTCPSRKLPCKHALGLLLNWASGTVPEQAAPAD